MRPNLARLRPILTLSELSTILAVPKVLIGTRHLCSCFRNPFEMGVKRTNVAVYNGMKRTSR